MNINGKWIIVADKVTVAEKIRDAIRNSENIEFEKKEECFLSGKIRITGFWGFSKTLEEQASKIALLCKDADLIINALPTGNLLLQELFITFLTQFKIFKPVKIISTNFLNDKALAKEFERVSTSIVPVNIAKAEEAFAKDIEKKYQSVQ